MPGQEEDISPYATFHLLGMREEAKNGTTMDQTALKTPNPKCRLLLAACVYLSDAPSPPRFLFGVVKQFCMFGIWPNTQCITPAYALHITKKNPPPPPPPPGCV
jgi:hypothetical protein